MSVNESIYGLKENWTPRNLYGDYPTNYPEDEKLKIANFLNNPLTVSGDYRNGCCLGSAFYAQTQDTSPYYNPNLDLGQPIPDMSVCFTGLSGYSPYLNIRFISTRTDATDGQEYQLSEETTQTYDIFNFCYNTVLGSSFGSQQKCFPLDKNETVAPGDSELNAKLYDIRLYPEPINKGLPSRQLLYCYTPLSSRNTICFVVQLPVKHIVLIPFITARDTNGNTIKHDLKRYVTEDKENYPRIVDITLRTYSSTTDTHFNYGQQLGINNYNIYTALSDYYGQAESGVTHRIKQTNLVIPFIPCQGIKIGGCITGDDITRYQKTDTSVLNHIIAMYAYVDCVSLRWDSYSGDGTPMTDSYCYCDVSRYTDAEIYDSIYKATACFGLFFTDSSTDVYNMYLDDDNMCLGILRDGIGYGQWTSGVRNREQPQWNWKDLSESPYDPSPPDPDPNVYDTASQLNTPSRCSSGTKYYVLNAAAIENLVGELWKAQENIPSDTSYMDFNNEQYLSNNPIDMIVSCKRFPLAPLKASDSEALVLGQYQTNVQGYELSDTTTWLNLGSKLIYKHFKNYLDYQTKIALYIPFCGMVNLDPSVWMGHTVNVYMAIDYITGSCTAFLIRDKDKVIYATAEGNCSVDLPVTGLQSATIESQLMRSKSSLDSSKLMIGAKIIGGITAFGVAAASGGTGAAAAPAIVGGVTTIASTISDGYKVNQLNYDLHHTEAPVQQIGSSSPLNAWSGELECRLYVYYPAVDHSVDNAAYSHSIGNATVQQGTIGLFGSSGEYAVITNADLSNINCTDSEKVMINNALTSGVYL